MARIHIVNSGRTIDASAAVSILNNLLREGERVSHLCGGKAQCGTCRIAVLAGANRLSPMTEIEKRRLGRNGGPAAHTENSPVIRLACQTYCFGDITLRILAPGAAPSP